MNDHERVEAHHAAFPDAGVRSPVCAIALLAAAILLAVGLTGVNPVPAQSADVAHSRSARLRTEKTRR